MTSLTRQSLKDLWTDVRTECSWKHLGRALWQNKGVLALVGGFLGIAGYGAPLTFDPTTSTLTAPQLAELVRVQGKPIVFAAGFLLTVVLCMVQAMSLTSFWGHPKRGLCAGILITLAFWGGVYATTALYTTVIADTSTIVLHTATEHSIPLGKE
jgi:hypothetical protein